MNFLSLFDGMSSGQQACDRLGITGLYYASEIEKSPQAVTRYNYPDTIFLGDVRNINVFKLEPIDLLMGGSPCQSFSMAGKRNGMTTIEDVKVTTLEQYLELKEGGFEFDGQSYLLWEYVRILRDIQSYNPDVKFLLENVLMDKQWQGIIDEALGISPVEINSALVSAQNRRRLYWTNIGPYEVDLFGNKTSAIPQPEDKGILLKDVIESGLPFINNNGVHKEITQGMCLDANYHKGMDNHGQRTMIKETKNYIEVKNVDSMYESDNRYYKSDKKHGTLQANGERKTGLYQIVAQIGRPDKTEKNIVCLTPKRTEYAKQIRKKYEAGEIKEKRKNMQKLEPRTDGKTNVLTTVEKDNYLMNTENYQIRRLTPIECERLQTVKDDYTKYCINEKGEKVEISNTQRYKMLGNGWTVDVIKHIFSFMEV